MGVADGKNTEFFSHIYEIQEKKFQTWFYHVKKTLFSISHFDGI